VEGRITVVLSGPPEHVAAAHVEPRALAVEMLQAQRIGRFELIRELARGGMGQVFLARDTKLGRRVAVKFLLQADPRLANRFVIEAQATARCTHENIVTIFEVGEHQGLPFMVLEYLEGKTLAQHLEQGVATRELVDIMIPVLRALECAHAAGIVHRDLKPSNIFVTDQGAVKVLDFGVAKWFDVPVASDRNALPGACEAEPHLTFSELGSLIGTAPYMSPEQWGADAVDHASDIWALGIMFWHALAGAHPVGSTAPEALRAELTQLAKPLPSIATQVPDLALQLVAIVDRSLAKPRSARYASAAELLADLLAFVRPVAVRDGDSPYRGLAAFGESDSRYFFGRANETRTALAQLDQWPLLAVLGPSGAGKSSFVHAGLVPAIRASGDWNVHVLRPGRAPLARLANVMGRDHEPTLHDAPGVLGEALRTEAAAASRRILLVVDQLEELFTLCDDERARSTFLAALSSAADDPSSPVRVVVSMRADYLDRLAAHEPFFADVSRGLLYLSMPGAEALRETIVRPAEMAGFAFEDPRTADDMLQASSSRGGLPLLQFAVTRLWDARDERRKVLTVAAYKQMGGVGGAFSRHAEEVAAGVPSIQQPLLRAIMMRLVTREGTRAVVDRSELASLARDPRTVEDVLDHLVRARLVHLDTELAGNVTVELVHDVLITEWPTLRRWLDDDQAARVLLHELGQTAKQWDTRGRPDDLVWRGTTAKESLAIVDRAVTLAWSATERAFIAAIRAQLAKSRRRRMITASAIVAMLVLLTTAGAIAMVRISNAERTAVQKAIAADAEASRARTAEAETARQLALVKAEEVRREHAEAERHSAEQSAARAKAAVALSRDELERANADLQNALMRSQQTEARAREAAAKEREASAALNAANARLNVLLEKERERVREYERERKDIATKLGGGGK
jgi:hypothetical protein